MKMTLRLAILVLLTGIANAGFAQKVTQDSTKAKDTSASVKKDSTLNAVLSGIEEIKKQLKDASLNDKEPTGIIYFDTLKKVTVYNNSRKTARTVLVDRITLLVRDGYIIDVNIFTTNGKVFTNTRSPITLNGNYISKTARKTDKLYNKRDREESIILQDVLYYDPLTTFYPEDDLYKLDHSNCRDTLKKNVGLNTVLDLRLYTDALGAIGKEPNGIVLTDIRIKQFFHRLHYSNSNMRIFNYAKLNFNASKMDSKFSFVDSSNEVSRSQLMQRAKVSGEVSINLFSDWLNRKSINDWYIDVGAGFHSTDLAREKDTVSIITQTVFFEGGVDLRNSSNIGFDMYGRFIIQYSPQTDFVAHNHATQFLKVGGEVYWNPFKDAASRIFARINYTMGLKKQEGKNSYSQVQIGYSTLLSKAIGLK